MESRFVNQKTSPIIFFEIEVDDMGLNVYEFRLYSHIVRRTSGGRGECWSSERNMATHCMMSPSSVKRALKGLISRNMLQVEKRKGYQSTYTLTDKSNWHNQKTREIVPRVQVSDPSPPGLTDPSPLGLTDLPPRSHRPTPLGLTDLPPRSHRPTMKKTPKVNKIKKTHERESAHTARAPRPKTETEKSPLREAFELHYEGEADNEKAMGGLVKLAEKWGVTVESLSSFMKWMEAYYPSKRFIFYGFKDHYQEFMLVKGRNPKETPQQRAAREYNESTAELQKRIKAAEAAEAAKAAESHSVSTMACKEPLKTSLKVQQESKPTDMERWVKLREEKIKLTKQKTMDPIPTKGNTQEEWDEEWVEKRKRELHKLAKKAERLTVVKTAQN